MTEENNPYVAVNVSVASTKGRSVVVAAGNGAKSHVNVSAAKKVQHVTPAPTVYAHPVTASLVASLIQNPNFIQKPNTCQPKNHPLRQSSGSNSQSSSSSGVPICTQKAPVMSEPQ